MEIMEQEEQVEPEVAEEFVEQPAEPAEQVNPWDGFTPSKFGLDKRYDTLNPEQFAKEIKYRNETYGRQSQELGELRRKSREYEEKLKRFMEAADKPVEQPQSQGPDEFTIKQFYDLMEKGQPNQALDLLLKDRLNPKFDGEDFQKAVDQRVQDHLNQYYTYTNEEKIKSDPDYPIYANYIEVLKSPEHFGGHRRPSELLEFSKMAAENKTLADLVYSNMKRYPDMPIEDAKKFANLTLNHSSTESGKKEEFKKTVNKLNDLAPTTSPAKASEVAKIGNMEDAFNV